jgi:hypothetical protein
VLMIPAGGELNSPPMAAPRLHDPEDHERFLGKTFVTRLSEVALQIGQDTWTRHELANDLGCGNYRAAALVTRAMRRLKVRSVQEVFTFDPIDLAGIHNLGETGMWVLLRALEARGYNTLAWYGATKKDHDLVTFRTLKIRRKKRNRSERRNK